ncbi:hypothetical protein [Gimesia chilikensis]|uniref:hypothetical protein n=1 Tax=Gimesia chilikensis TaxID=2605989 RepID=UPI0018D86080|nr:hypothetical protein [Gimesia chilikensis]
MSAPEVVPVPGFRSDSVSDGDIQDLAEGFVVCLDLFEVVMIDDAGADAIPEAGKPG